MEPKFTVEYTQAEANAALRLYDLALRSQGMSVVEAVVRLSNKLTQAATKANQQLKVNGDAAQPPPEMKQEPKKVAGKH